MINIKNNKILLRNQFYLLNYNIIEYKMDLNESPFKLEKIKKKFRTPNIWSLIQSFKINNR